MMNEREEPQNMQEEQEKRRFIFSNALRGIIWLGVIIGGYILASQYLPKEWENVLNPITDRPFLMFSVFFLSETIIGIIPPEFFVIWASSKAFSPFLSDMILLSVLSWAGGLIAYFTGRKFYHSKWFTSISEKDNFQRYRKLYLKFGAIVIIVAALTPLPYALISFLSATFKFPLNKYLMYSTFRFIKFIILGWLFWNINVS